ATPSMPTPAPRAPVPHDWRPASSTATPAAPIMPATHLEAPQLVRSPGAAVRSPRLVVAGLITAESSTTIRPPQRICNRLRTAPAKRPCTVPAVVRGSVPIQSRSFFTPPLMGVAPMDQEADQE